MDALGDDLKKIDFEEMQETAMGYKSPERKIRDAQWPPKFIDSLI